MLAGGWEAPDPVRSRGVRSADFGDGSRRSSFRLSEPSGRAVVGCRPGRRGHHGNRGRARRRRQRTRRRLRFAVRARLRAGCPGGTAIRHLHGDHSATHDPLRDGARCLLPVPRSPVHRPQRHAHQLRLPAGRTFPADALHRRRCPADRDDQVVLRLGRQAASIGTGRRPRPIGRGRICGHRKRIRVSREIGVRIEGPRRRFRSDPRGAASTPARHPLPVGRGPTTFRQGQANVHAFTPRPATGR